MGGEDDGILLVVVVLFIPFMLLVSLQMYGIDGEAGPTPSGARLYEL